MSAVARPLSALLVALSVACFNPDDPPNLGTESSSSGDTGGAGTAGTAGATTAVETTSGSSSTGAATEASGESQGETQAETTGGGVRCGDGVPEGDEACDDGNSVDGDGCSTTCVREDGWQCDDASPSGCVAPDLSVRVVAAAFVANGLQLTYVVANSGGLASGPYRVDLWDTRTGGFANPPVLGDDGVVTFADKPSLPAGGTQMFNDTIPSPVNGTHVAFAVVDSANEIVEQDENDNIALGMAWTNAGLTVHRSFVSPLVPVQIPADTGVATVGVDVSVPVNLPEVFFSVNITHPDVSDLQLRVIAPNGVTRDLILGTPGGANLASTTFRGGGAGIGEAEAPYAGAFEFAGEWAGTPTFDGEWTLSVGSRSGLEGRINGFSVSFFELDP